MIKTLITFGNSNYDQALIRIKKQAEDLGIFDNIYIVDEKILNKDTSFFKEHQNLINSEIPGFGGWLWKSYIIQSAFKKFPSSDIFMYIDSGSEFNINEKSVNRLKEYFDISFKHEFLAFYNRDVEANLSHCSVIDAIYPLGKHTNQFEANLLFIKNTDKNLEIINEWQSLCIENNYYNIWPFNKNKCCDLFGSHLHDQSVLSLVLKKYSCYSLPDESSWYFPSKMVSSVLTDNLEKFPIFTARNKSLESILGKCVAYKEFKICKDLSNDCQNFIRVR